MAFAEGDFQVTDADVELMKKNRNMAMAQMICGFIAICSDIVAALTWRWGWGWAFPCTPAGLMSLIAGWILYHRCRSVLAVLNTNSCWCGCIPGDDNCKRSVTDILHAVVALSAIIGIVNSILHFVRYAELQSADTQAIFIVTSVVGGVVCIVIFIASVIIGCGFKDVIELFDRLMEQKAAIDAQNTITQAVANPIAREQAVANPTEQVV